MTQDTQTRAFAVRGGVIAGSLHPFASTGSHGQLPPGPRTLVR